jgi:hypothetical protein
MSSDSCALSLQPFKAPVAVLADVVEGETPRADVFDLLNIVPYIRKFKTSESRYNGKRGERLMCRSCIGQTTRHEPAHQGELLQGMSPLPLIDEGGLMSECGRNDARPNHLQSLFPSYPYSLPQEYRKSYLQRLS